MPVFRDSQGQSCSELVRKGRAGEGQKQTAPWGPIGTFWMVVLNNWRCLWTRPWSTWHCALAQGQVRNGDRPCGKSRLLAVVSISGMGHE